MSLTRRRYTITGIVQGVGFRPFVYRIALESGLVGWVRNTPAGVEIEVQGSDAGLTNFDNLLTSELPPLAVISSHHREEIPLSQDDGFSILASAGGDPAIQIASDSAVCGDCLSELFDPANRRYRYPFITCTNCGPRYSIITGIPYDRPKTTMAAFPLCPACLGEYHDPADRRFHAQPIACRSCGPRMKLLDKAGEVITAEDNAVLRGIELLREGAILAIKGIGGYHLAVDACNPDTVLRLRTRKQRDEKPFAVMAADLDTARTLGILDDMEERLLSSSEAPIVIVRKRPDTSLSPLIAPDNGWLGLMLPYAPLHHLLLRGNFMALVMTSGNVSDEPVAFEDDDALRRLAGIADCFLLHDRPIHIRSDDSVMRVFQGRPLFYRRARGYAPRAVTLPFRTRPVLAMGAELKSAVCLADRERAFLSQHIGDLQNDSTCDSFRHTVAHLSQILRIEPQAAVCDLHPDYLSTRFAEESCLPLVRVQHHHAHLASCMAENGLDGTAIGVILDGTGYGDDGSIWGGEFLVGGYHGYRRAGHFRPLPLLGGDAAVREPWRMALSYLHAAIGADAFDIDHPLSKRLGKQERGLFSSMLLRGINSPLTSSCGRLFDAVAALLNIRHFVSYDGQAAIELEALAETAWNYESAKSPLIKGDSGGFASDTKIKFPPSPLCQRGEYSYAISLHSDSPLQLDFSALFPEILADMQAGVQASVIAYRFHVTVASSVVEACLRISESTGLDRVLLSGGVFQNRLLSEMVYTSLASQGFNVFTHRLVPPNDGGIALGQAAIAAHAL
ncbi:MAG: carbamoyltransferase HypF [Geobacteraceae bacterium GWC2_55_20]|nr:MAG: carbamoyltransferase HypF [Geobacteraceae bacterium GWC2_55_20]OGU23891.1 MAG: carbamoyltransferase HypF [Geobacteraceae bacterium GWF2_54_21]HCE67199.1 carbamoyltransferase HypF [Geobacter sp.]